MMRKEKKMRKKLMIILCCLVIGIGLMPGISWGAGDETSNVNIQYSNDSSYYYTYKIGSASSQSDYIGSLSEAFNEAKNVKYNNWSNYKNYKLVLNNDTNNFSGDLVNTLSSSTVNVDINGKTLNISGGNFDRIGFVGSGSLNISGGDFSDLVSFDTNLNKSITGGTFNGGNFSGNVNINGGTLSPGTYSFSTATTISGVTLSPGTYKFDKDVTLSNVTFSGGGTYIFSGSGDVNISGGTFSGDVNISGGTLSPGTYSFSTATTISGVTLSPGTYKFDKDVTLSNVTFSGGGTYIFSDSGDVNISGGTFSGDVNISGGTLSPGTYSFSTATTISGVTLSPGTYKFDKDVTLSNVTFSGGGTYDFSGNTVKINGGTYSNTNPCGFKNAVFETTPADITGSTFTNVTFSTTVDNLTSPTGVANAFEKVTFSKKAAVTKGSFSNTTFSEGADVSGGTFDSTQFNSAATVSGGNFEKTVFNNTADISGGTFKGSTFNDTTTITSVSSEFGENTTFNGVTTVADTGNNNNFDTVSFTDSSKAYIKGNNNTFNKSNLYSSETTIAGKENKFTTCNLGNADTDKITISGEKNKFTTNTTFKGVTTVADTGNQNNFDTVSFTDISKAYIYGYNNTFNKSNLYSSETTIAGKENKFTTCNLGNADTDKITISEEKNEFTTNTTFNGVTTVADTGNQNNFDTVSFTDISKAYIYGYNNTFNKSNLYSSETTIAGKENKFTTCNLGNAATDEITISGEKNKFTTNSTFDGAVTITETGDDNSFDSVTFTDRSTATINGDKNLFNKTTINSSKVELTGTVNKFTDSQIGNSTMTTYITISGTSNEFTDCTSLKGIISISGGSNSFSKGSGTGASEMSGTITINSIGNTFDTVIFTSDSDVTLKGNADSNAFKSGTEFNGKLIVSKGADSNTFNKVDFNGNMVVSGNSKFTEGTISSRTTINNGEFESVIFTTNSDVSFTTNSDVEAKVKLLDGSFYGKTTIFDGEFESTSQALRKPYEDLEKVRFFGETVISGGILKGAVFESGSKLEIKGPLTDDICVLTNTIYNISDIKKTNIVGLDNNSFTEIYYGTITKAINTIPENEYAKKVTLYDYNRTETAPIEVPGSKNVLLELNGCKVSTKIDNYGNMTIKDGSNTENTNDGVNKVELGTGEIAEINNYGSLVIKSGIYNKIDGKNVTIDKESIAKYLYKAAEGLKEQSSYCYVIDDNSLSSKNNKYYVLEKGNLDYSLNYEVYDSAGNVVKSIDSDSIQDVALGTKYTMNIYLKSDNADNVKLNEYDILLKYDKTKKIKIETPYSMDNRYTDVKHDSETGTIHYTLDNESYLIPAKTDESYEGIQIAKFDFTVEPDDNSGVEDLIEFSFDDSKSYVSVMDIKLNGEYVEIPIVSSTSKTVSTMNSFDGVEISSMKYAPDGYVLAIISKQLNDDQTLIFKGRMNNGDENDDLMYFTTETKFIAQSSNPDLIGYNEQGELKEGVLKGVYLGFVKIENLVNEGLLKESDVNDYSKISEAIDSKIEIKQKQSGDNSLTSEKNILKFDYDIDGDGKVDYNDASLVYQMLQKGGESWSLNKSDVGNYLSERGRLISVSGEKARLYGTIEDVAEIIANYDSLNTGN